MVASFDDTAEEHGVLGHADERGEGLKIGYDTADAPAL
jgi:hypothetical protein